jgi:endonuclease/exonuclease/phosphatase (EEP) superfamily protein YafD
MPLRPGSRGLGVVALQKRLRSAGFAYLNPSGVTGFYGRETIAMAAARDAARGEQLRFITANFWRENPQPAADLVLLQHSYADIVGLNEAQRFTRQLLEMGDFEVITGATPLLRNNPILIRVQERIRVTGFEVRQMCDAVGDSPARAATLAMYTVAGQQRAHLQTHLNAHIENAGRPRDLPRVQQVIHHMTRLQAWVRELRRTRPVTVSGDFNWAWSENDSHDWTYSPERVFARLGMRAQFEDSPPPGGTLGNRRVDYLFFDPRDLMITAQHIVSGEHSDHRWVAVDTETL